MASVSRADPFLLPHLVLGRSSICADCCMEWSNHCFLSTIQSSLSSFTSVAITWSSRNTTQPREGPTDLTRNVAGSSEKKKIVLVMKPSSRKAGFPFNLTSVHSHMSSYVHNLFLWQNVSDDTLVYSFLTCNYSCLHLSYCLESGTVLTLFHCSGSHKTADYRTRSHRKSLLKTRMQVIHLRAGLCFCFKTQILASWFEGASVSWSMCYAIAVLTHKFN